MSKSLVWNDHVPWDTVCRRASGRRGYNAHRAFKAAWRRVQVSNLLVKWGLEYGIQARIARQLGLSEATISRDIEQLMAESKPCPCCGSWRRQLYSRYAQIEDLDKKSERTSRNPSVNQTA